MKTGNADMLTLHALYFLAEAAGWRSGFTWRLTGRGVFSPELQRLLAIGRPPKLPHEATGKLRRLIERLCVENTGCGFMLIAAAKYLAFHRLGVDYRASHVFPEVLQKRIESALYETGLLPRKETIITPKLVAH